MHNAADDTRTIALQRIREARDMASRLLEQRKHEIREDLVRRTRRDETPEAVA